MQSSSELCPLRLTMDIIGGKWKLNIICLLKNGEPMRYNQIRRGVPGITNVMLAQSLKSLESYGLLQRTQYNEVPVRVEYQLTRDGMELLDLMRQLRDWGNRYMISHALEVQSLCPGCLMHEPMELFHENSCAPEL